MHGCKNVDSPVVKVDLYWTLSQWAVRIKDPGTGFQEDTIPSLDTPGAEMIESGRGILILRRYTDRLVFSQGGSEQTFWVEAEAHS